MPITSSVPSVTLNRLSVYLRCLRDLAAEGRRYISSQELAEQCHLSPAQIRKDLARFGEFGTRGVGYEIAPLARRLHELLGLDRKRRLIIVGAGRLGTALASYLGFNDASFEIVAGVDVDPRRVGSRVGPARVEHAKDLAEIVRRCRAEIAILAVPAEAAPACFETLCDAGINAVLNFAPVPLPNDERVYLKNVDLRTYLEEVSALLGGLSDLDLT